MELLKEYSDWMKSKGGYIAIGLIAFILIPMILFFKLSSFALGWIWFLISYVISISFSIFYFGDYRKKNK